ncbi:MAG: hypothetical protein HUK20_01680 [Fibrobacter sp.]|nr:hypothetical protein [Fibrobacter sp.]
MKFVLFMATLLFCSCAMQLTQGHVASPLKREIQEYKQVTQSGDGGCNIPEFINKNMGGPYENMVEIYTTERWYELWIFKFFYQCDYRGLAVVYGKNEPENKVLAPGAPVAHAVPVADVKTEEPKTQPDEVQTVTPVLPSVGSDDVQKVDGN